MTGRIDDRRLHEDVSARGIRAQIEKLVAAEDPKQPLTDQEIVQILQKDGINIARRTVAKYREAMRIPSSVQRRRDKQSMLGNALSAPATSSDRSRDTAPA